MAEDLCHRPVLLEEVLDALAVRPTGIYVDCTYGRGGHTLAILERLSPAGRMLVVDRDPEAVAAARARLACDPRVAIEQGSFTMLSRFLGNQGWLGRVDGILLDLGLSSPQLDTPERGFSFLRSGPLDMRFDPGAGESASAWLGRAQETELRQVLKDYGEERYARRIAHAIVRERAKAPITTTGRLAEIVSAAHPYWERDRHPATRTFQAIRVHINQELLELRSLLPQVVDALSAGGRACFISFHSLEDRIVKRFIREQARGDRFPSDIPVPHAQLRPTLRAVAGPIRPGTAEVEANPRARSALLRVAERLA
jgi:16S rRNA (cytosine1402-N4)-methyltransferase